MTLESCSVCAELGGDNPGTRRRGLSRRVVGGGPSHRRLDRSRRADREGAAARRVAGGAHDRGGGRAGARSPAAVAAVERVVRPERVYVASYGERVRHVISFCSRGPRASPPGTSLSDVYRRGEACSESGAWPPTRRRRPRGHGSRPAGRWSGAGRNAHQQPLSVPGHVHPLRPDHALHGRDRPAWSTGPSAAASAGVRLAGRRTVRRALAVELAGLVQGGCVRLLPPLVPIHHAARRLNRPSRDLGVHSRWPSGSSPSRCAALCGCLPAPRGPRKPHFLTRSPPGVPTIQSPNCIGRSRRPAPASGDRALPEVVAGEMGRVAPRPCSKA